MSDFYVLGSDIGSSSCKTLLADSTGRVVARATVHYPQAHPHPDWSEYDPQDWYMAFCDSTQAVLRQRAIDPATIQRVCIVGITHNPVLLDKTAHVLRPAIHFNDRRSMAQCEALLERWGEAVLHRSTNAIGPLWTLPQLLWVKEHEPDIWAQVASIAFPKDYVRNRLTFSNGPGLTDWIEATGTLFFDPVEREWIDDFLGEVQLTQDNLPAITTPTKIAGVVSKWGAADSGLATGTPVLIGTTDTAAEMLAAGAHTAGKGTVKLASVGRIAFIQDRAIRHPHILNYPFFEDLWYPGTATKYAASAYKWMHESLWAGMSPNDYPSMDAAAATVPTGAEGLIFLPHLMGQFAPYWNPRLSGAFVGVNLSHGLAHFTRALLEGVALNIREAFEEANQIGLDADEILLIGNGARSPLWSQIVADVLQRPLAIPLERDAAYGAVMLCGMQMGMLPMQLRDLHAHVQMAAIRHPDDRNAQLYDELYSIYRRANFAIGDVTEQLTNFRG